MKELDEADKRLRDEIVERLCVEYEVASCDIEKAIIEAYNEGFDSGYEIGCEDSY